MIDKCRATIALFDPVARLSLGAKRLRGSNPR
jgi:hypothetical protein